MGGFKPRRVRYLFPTLSEENTVCEQPKLDEKSRSEGIAEPVAQSKSKEACTGLGAVVASLWSISPVCWKCTGVVKGMS